MPLQFSIRRLLLILLIFAVALGNTRRFGPWSIAFAVIAATTLSGIVLIAKGRDAGSIIRSAISCGLGALVGLIFCPPIHPPYEPGDEFRYMMVGAVAGWVVGLAVGRREAAKKSHQPEHNGKTESPQTGSGSDELVE